MIPAGPAYDDEDAPTEAQGPATQEELPALALPEEPEPSEGTADSPTGEKTQEENAPEGRGGDADPEDIKAWFSAEPRDTREELDALQAISTQLDAVPVVDPVEQEDLSYLVEDDDEPDWKPKRPSLALPLVGIAVAVVLAIVGILAVKGYFSSSKGKAGKAKPGVEVADVPKRSPTPKVGPAKPKKPGKTGKPMTATAPKAKPKPPTAAAPGGTGGKAAPDAGPKEEPDLLQPFGDGVKGGKPTPPKPAAKATPPPIEPKAAPKKPKAAPKKPKAAPKKPAGGKGKKKGGDDLIDPFG